jgi:propionyl-CoA carboxylase beta chain
MSGNDWQDEIAEIRRRQALAAEMGGVDRVARQKSRGKLTVRERIVALLDEGSFREWGSLAGEGRYDADGQLAGFRASSCLVGRGAIDGRAVVVSADDFTIRGGSSETYHHEKNVQAELMAAEYGLPLVRLLDGTGGGGSVAEVEKLGATYVPYVPGFDQVVANLGRVPVVSLGTQDSIGAHQMWLAFNGGEDNGLKEGFFPPVFQRIHSTEDKLSYLNGEDVARFGRFIADLTLRLDRTAP